MKKENIKDYTLRITNANSAGLVAIKFDIFDDYMEAAISGMESCDAAWKDELRRAVKVLESFKSTLDFKYPLAGELFSIYQYCEKLCCKGLSLKDKEALKEAASLMKKLGSSFKELAEKDDSAPLMANSEQIIVGMTYARGSLQEGTMYTRQNRGFLA